MVHQPFPGCSATEDDAQALSADMGVPAIFYGNSDTAGCVEYALFEEGERTELLRYGVEDAPELFDEAESDEEENDDEEDDDSDEIEFESSRRDLDTSDGNAYEIVEETFRSLDAYAPGIRIDFRTKPGQERTFKMDEGDELLDEVHFVDASDSTDEA